MENKEIIVVSSAFAVVVALAMYMFVSQQKNNNMVKESIEIKGFVESKESELRAQDSILTARLDSITRRLDQTDERFHNNQ